MRGRGGAGARRVLCADVSGVDRVLAFLASVGNVDAMSEHWTDDVVLELPYADPPIVLSGRRAVQDYLREALTVFTLTLRVTDVYDCPARGVVVAEYTSEGRVTTTGKPYANQYIGVFELRGDLIGRQREFYNPVPAMHALS